MFYFSLQYKEKWQKKNIMTFIRLPQATKRAPVQRGTVSLIVWNNTGYSLIYHVVQSAVFHFSPKSPTGVQLCYDHMATNITVNCLSC